MMRWALACEPKLLIADEPTTASTLLPGANSHLIRELQVRLKLAVSWQHDLAWSP